MALETAAAGAEAETPGEAAAAPDGKVLNLQFLRQTHIAPYIRHLEQGAGHYLSGFDVFDSEHDWNSETFPLGLCEFLAYKTGLAYYEAARIERNLLDEHPGGISYFQFFDSPGGHGDT